VPLQKLAVTTRLFLKLLFWNWSHDHPYPHIRKCTNGYPDAGPRPDRILGSSNRAALAIFATLVRRLIRLRQDQPNGVSQLLPRLVRRSVTFVVESLAWGTRAARRALRAGNLAVAISQSADPIRIPESVLTQKAGVVAPEMRRRVRRTQ